MSVAAQPACDSAVAQCGKPAAAPEFPWWVLAATILASSLAFVDGTVVNVALPTIGRNLGTDTAALQWVVNSYLLPLSAMLLLGGAAGDHFGRRRLLIAGTSIFALASLGCALAVAPSLLLTSRLIQGIGAAMLMPNSLAILGQSFSGEAKGRAIGIWAASGAAMGAIGPVLGGWFIDLGSWRAIFLINLPLAVGAIVLALRFVPRDHDTHGRSLDVVGGALATLGLGALTWALTVGAGPSGWTRAAGATAVIACGLLIYFVVFEKRLGERAMMPLKLFGSKTLVGLNLFTLLFYGALGGLFVLIPYVLIKGSNYSAIAAGAALLPLPLVLSTTSPLAGSLAARIGPRPMLTFGPLLVGAGFLLALRIDGSADYGTRVLPAILVMAFGMSGAVAPLTTAVLTSVDAEHTGSASGLNSAVARVGGLIATALLGSVLAAEGPRLFTAFHVAMWLGATTCVLSSLAAALLVRSPRPGTP